MCGIEEVDAQKLLLLMRTYDGFHGKMSLDATDSVTTAAGSYQPNDLLAIRYPSEEAGPQSKGGKAVHIHHMCAFKV